MGMVNRFDVLIKDVTSMSKAGQNQVELDDILVRGISAISRMIGGIIG